VDGPGEDKNSPVEMRRGDWDVLSFRILMAASVVVIEAAVDESVAVGVPFGLYWKALV
jgi:hypothetical protein